MNNDSPLATGLIIISLLFSVHRSRPSVRKWQQHESPTPQQRFVLASLPVNLLPRKPKSKTYSTSTHATHSSHNRCISGENFHSGPTPSFVGMCLMIKKAKTAWLTAPLCYVWNGEVEPSVQICVNVIHECVRVFGRCSVIFHHLTVHFRHFMSNSINQSNISDAPSISNEHD